MSNLVAAPAATCHCACIPTSRRSKSILLLSVLVLSSACIIWSPNVVVVSMARIREIDSDDWATCGVYRPSTLSNALPNVYKCPNDPYKTRSGQRNKNYIETTSYEDEPTLKDEILLNIESGEFPFFVSLRIKARSKGLMEGWPKGQIRYWTCPGIIFHSNKVLVARDCLRLHHQNAALFSIEAVFKPQPERGNPLPVPPTSNPNDRPPGPDEPLNKTLPLPLESMDSNPSGSIVWKAVHACTPGYKNLGPTKPKHDEVKLAELILVQLEAHVRYGQGIHAPCLPAGQTDAQAECALIKLASDDVLRRSPAITAVIVNRTQPAKGEPLLEVGYSRWNMFQLKGSERVCMQDYGSPIVCKYQCALGYGKYALAGIVMGVAGAPNWDTAYCQKEQITSMPIIAFDVWEQRDQIFRLYDRCGSRGFKPTEQPDDQENAARLAQVRSSQIDHRLDYLPAVRYLL